MRGHIAKKGKRYYVVIENGVATDTGKRTQKRHSGGASKRGAEVFLAELLESKRTDTYVEPPRLTVAQYLRDEWLLAAQHRLRHSTYDSYRHNIERHVIPRIGRVSLQKLRPADLTRLYSALVTRQGSTQVRRLASRSGRRFAESRRVAWRDPT